MAVLTMQPTLGDLLKYELEADYCREAVTLKGGTAYLLGAVLGRVTASGQYILSPAATVVGEEGAETAIAVLLEAVDASAGDSVGVIAARGPVLLAQARLVFDASVDQPAEVAAKLGQLAALGLVTRLTA
jgi:Bacteriophage lambda head decoration protein D